MRKLLAFLFSVLLVVGVDARAADRIETSVPIEDRYRGPDYDFVRNLFFEMIGPEMVAKSYPGTMREAFYENFAEFFDNWIDPKLSLDENIEDYVDDAVHVGYADLNDDGVDELLVMFETRLACGTIGCSSWIFTKRDGVWTEIADWSSSGVAMTQERVGGYRTLRSTETGLRWIPQRAVYGGVCIDRYTGVEGGGRCLDVDGAGPTTPPSDR